MANTIRIKRRAAGGGAGAPSTLENAELAFNESSAILYYGTGTGGLNGSATSVIAIGGAGAYLGIASGVTATAAGTYTFSGSATFTGTTAIGAATATSPTTNDDSTRVATTEWVKDQGYSTTSGTVTSVGLSLPAIFTVSGSPVTGSGTLTGSLATQVANKIFAGPTTGSDAAPTFRALVASDIPDISSTYLTVSTASSTYLSQSSASSTYLSQSTASSTYAPLASPALTGTPSAPTAAANTNTTQIATTAFVQAAVAAATPAGVAYVGQANTFASGYTQTFAGTLDVTGTLKISGTTVSATAAELNLLNTASAGTVVNSKAVIYGSAGEVAASSISTTGNVTVGGNLTVNGTTTTINSTTVSTDDKNIVLADTASPSDASADGGGITLKGTTDKTLNWVDATDSWTSSEHVDLASGKSYLINGSAVLSSSTLGSGVTASSLTSVGTLTSGSLGTGFTAVAVPQGGTGVATLTGLVKGNGTSAFSAAVAGTDYLSPSSDIDGGSY